MGYNTHKQTEGSKTMAADKKPTKKKPAKKRISGAGAGFGTNATKKKKSRKA